MLVVPSVEEALAHYREKLGFEGEAYEGDPEVYGYARRDGCELHLARGEPAQPNHEAVPPDLFDVYLWVDDVEALHEEFKTRGADVILGPTTQEYRMREIRVRDPDGYILAFGQPAQGGTGT